MYKLLSLVTLGWSLQVDSTPEPECHEAKVILSDRGCDIAKFEIVQHHLGLADNDVFETRRVIDEEEEGEEAETIIDIFGTSAEIVQKRVQEICGEAPEEEVKAHSSTTPANVRKLRDAGDAMNRIDVTFMGDGYTAAEEKRFFDDIERLTSDMFNGETFKYWLPLFNVWAIFEASAESGIGRNGQAKNTRYQLYRNGSQLRGIFPGNRQALRDDCKLTGRGGCDYPSVIANDEYYGGLGGEFVISTRSIRSATVVLAHEMGHNFVDVGEEYDGGVVYSGANSDTTAKTDKWTKWLTLDTPREERATILVNEYPWHQLYRNGTLNYTWKSSGEYERIMVSMSVTGLTNSNQMTILLDGKPLDYNVDNTLDRQIFPDIILSANVNKGDHKIEFQQTTNPPDANNEVPLQIASVKITELGSEAQYITDNKDYISAFPTFDIDLKKTFRPTSNHCLMRDMVKTYFCPICIEEMWLQFFQRVSVIDAIEAKRSYMGTQISARVIPIGQFRETPVGLEGEKLEISWKKDQMPRSEFDGKFEFTVPANEAIGQWEATVRYVTPQIRKETNLTTFTKTVTIS